MRLGEEVRGFDVSFAEGTLVIHGLADRLCGASGGQATAEAIPGAELLLIEGMGHDLPRALQTQIAARIAEFVWRVEGR